MSTSISYFRQAKLIKLINIREGLSDEGQEEAREADGEVYTLNLSLFDSVLLLLLLSSH